MANTTLLLRRFGQRVRSFRTATGKSQEALADSCGFDRTYISLVERGRRNPSLVNLLRLARGLGVGAGELLEGLEHGA